jgi:hypothetical protein
MPTTTPAPTAAPSPTSVPIERADRPSAPSRRLGRLLLAGLVLALALGACAKGGRPGYVSIDVKDTQGNFVEGRLSLYKIENGRPGSQPVKTGTHGGGGVPLTRDELDPRNAGVYWLCLTVPEGYEAYDDSDGSYTDGTSPCGDPRTGIRITIEPNGTYSIAGGTGGGVGTIGDAPHQSNLWFVVRKKPTEQTKTTGVMVPPTTAPTHATGPTSPSTPATPPGTGTPVVPAPATPSRPTAPGTPTAPPGTAPRPAPAPPTDEVGALPPVELPVIIGNEDQIERGTYWEALATFAPQYAVHDGIIELHWCDGMGIEVDDVHVPDGLEAEMGAGQNASIGAWSTGRAWTAIRRVELRFDDGTTTIAELVPSGPGMASIASVPSGASRVLGVSALIEDPFTTFGSTTLAWEIALPV